VTLARDAALAAVVLAVVAAAGALTGTSLAPGAAVAGAAGAVALELLASRRAVAVRRVWSRPPVRVLAVAAAVAVVAAVAVRAPTLGLNALAGGLLAYLALVALVAGGVVPPTTAWR